MPPRPWPGGIFVFVAAQEATALALLLWEQLRQGFVQAV